MKYQLLGKLPKETIEFFLAEILRRKENKPYQWIQFDEYLNSEFMKVFSNTELKIQYSNDNKRPIQKAFYSAPGYGFRIHKDGTHCKSALNVAISCNSGDWVRWYDEDYINSISNLKTTTNVVDGVPRLSRDTDIPNYESVPFTHELHNEIGDVYALDVGSYHSFKCVGDKPRIIIQTKFEDFPDFDTIRDSLTKNSFSNLIKDNNDI